MKSDVHAPIIPRCGPGRVRSPVRPGLACADTLSTHHACLVARDGEPVVALLQTYGARAARPPAGSWPNVYLPGKKAQFAFLDREILFPA
ncbi:hypothetical protein [Streptomyces sp. NPDC007991]|uniref:hypothetical protein n=1 Tax=Streptomyces sp. NPDC007991 TaxID=3364803 RepID=UPI0036EFF345